MSRHALLLSLTLLVCTPALAQSGEEPGSPPEAAADPAPAQTPAAAPAPVPAAAPATAPGAGQDTAPVESSEEAAAEKAEDLDLMEEDLDTTLEIFRRGPVRLTVGGLLQVQAAFHVGDEAATTLKDPFNNEGFRIRRARLGFGGTLMRHWEYYLALDLKDTVLAAMGGDMGTDILDGTISWTRFPFARVTLGVSKVPLSAWSLESTSKLELGERPLVVRELSPDRRVGMTLQGDVWRVQYAAGLYNGSDGLTSGNIEGLAGGVFMQVHLLGKPTEFVPDALRLSLGGGYLYEDGPTANKHRASANMDLRLYHVRLRGEILYEATATDSQPTTSGKDSGDSSRFGAAGEVSGFLWREYLQLVFRYEYYQDNGEDVPLASQQLFTGGLNFYLMRNNLKLMLNYIHRNEIDGVDLDNDIAYAQLQAAF